MNPTLYQIVLTNPRNPDEGAVWTGYASYGQAVAALREADLMIPWFWQSEIVKQ